MTWDPEEYGNLTILTFDSEKVWIPDVAMTNAADHLYAISRDSRFVVRVSYDGLFKYVPTGTARTWCGKSPFLYFLYFLQFFNQINRTQIADFSIRFSNRNFQNKN